VTRDSRRIEIRNEILENFNYPVTWGFGFNLAAPDVWHREVGRGDPRQASERRRTLLTATMLAMIGSPLNHFATSATAVRA